MCLCRQCVSLPAGAFFVRSCFPMLPHCLSCRVSRGAATLPHRLPLRSIPPQRFACGSSHHEDRVVHGLCGRFPDSAGNACSLNYCCSDIAKSVGPSAPIAYATSVSPPDEAAAWPGCRCWMLDMSVAWPGAAFLQITARTNPCSRHLWGTLARAVASI